jgi:hypothetical protein
MEGVLVGAKAIGSTVRATVVTDRQCRYVFPRQRLAAGRYQLSVRATGYDLKDPDRRGDGEQGDRFTSATPEGWAADEC